MNRKFCEFPAVGAQEAASAIRRMCSLGTRTLRNFRMLCRPFIVSRRPVDSSWVSYFDSRFSRQRPLARVRPGRKLLEGGFLLGDLLREGLDLAGLPRCFPVRRGVRIPEGLDLAHLRVVRRRRYDAAGAGKYRGHRGERDPEATGQRRFSVEEDIRYGQ